MDDHNGVKLEADIGPWSNIAHASKEKRREKFPVTQSFTNPAGDFLQESAARSFFNELNQRFDTRIEAYSFRVNGGIGR
jgi:hypothetical protein